MVRASGKVYTRVVMYLILRAAVTNGKLLMHIVCHSGKRTLPKA